MGEIAEMMLDGTLCEGCGEFLDNGSPGFPQYCAGCRPPQGYLSSRHLSNVEARARKKEACPNALASVRPGRRLLSAPIHARAGAGRWASATFRNASRSCCGF